MPASLRFLTDGIGIPRKRLLSVILLFSGTLAWFYFFNIYALNMILLKNVNSNLIVIGNIFFYIALISSGFIGAYVSKKVDRKKLLFYWLIFGLISTVLVEFSQDIFSSLVICILLGISFGLGFPSCQAYLTEATNDEERGRIAGLAVFVTFLLVIIIISLVDLIGTQGALILALALKGSGLLALIGNRFEQIGEKSISIGGILRKKNFLFYTIPWLLFQITNGIALFGVAPTEFSEIAVYSQIIQFAGTLLTVLIAGLLADRLGRKLPIITGLLLLGISYVVFGLVTTQLTYLVFSLIGGIAWGLLAVSYMIVILGDISSMYQNKERFYAIGSILAPLLTFIIFYTVQQLSGIIVPLNQLSSALSIVIFVSILPILYAPETLSETKIQQRRLKEHLKKIQDLIKEPE